MRPMQWALVAILLLPAGVVLAGDQLHADLESSDLDIRRAAARRLSESANSDDLGELIRAVRREGDGETRRLMVVALGRIGNQRAVWDLFRLLQDPGGAALWSIRTILDGKPPCPPDDAGRLGDLDRVWREQTLTWWKTYEGLGQFRPYSVLLPTPEQEAVLLRELRSSDERVALRAAERLKPHRLTQDELRIQASLLARHPHSWALQAIGRPIGTADFPTLWARLATSDLLAADCQGRTHWALHPDAIPVLVSLLPKANPEWFRVFRGLLGWIARDSDRFRLDAARGFVFALARLDAERDGAEPPELSEFEVELPGEGLPPAFVTLVRNHVELNLQTNRAADDSAAWIPPLPWLRRWARELQPTMNDLPLLLEIIREAKDLKDRAWAVRAIGRITDLAATNHLENIAGHETDTALFAAAELAKDGKPHRFRELFEKRAGNEIAYMLAFEVMPEDAIRIWNERIVQPEPADSWGSRNFDPSAEADLERIADYGVRFREEDREALAGALPVEQVTLDTLVWFLTEVSAAPLNGPSLERILERLRGYEVDEDAHFDPTPMRRMLALLEVRVPERLVQLLHHWVGHREGVLRAEALLLLGKLGDSRFVAEMIDVWAGSDVLAYEAGWLGRVKDQRVKEYLELGARTAPPDASGKALSALSVYHGLPEEVAGAFIDPEFGVTDPEAIGAARSMLLDGDAVGAVLLLLDGGAGVGIRSLGLIDDPRALEALRKLLSDRKKYWEAVAGLALAGDSDAKGELAGIIRDGRTWIFYPLVDGRVFTFDLDPAWIDYWVDRVDSTCCIGFSALESLGQLFPMLCTQGVGNRNEIKELIVRWWQNHRNHLAYSRILDGWITTR